MRDEIDNKGIIRVRNEEHEEKWPVSEVIE